MQNEFYNQPVVNWAKQNLAQPVEIKVHFTSGWGKFFVYSLLFLVPLIFILLGIVMMIGRTHAEDKSGMSALVCGFVMLIPTGVIAVLGALMQQKFVKSLDAEGVKSSMGRRFLWQNLYYIDHVSKITYVRGVSRKTEDNQLELVFAEGKVIIPPLIHDRERVWGLINSIPAQVRVDGEVRAAQSSPVAPIIEDFLKAIGHSNPPSDPNK